MFCVSSVALEDIENISIAVFLDFKGFDFFKSLDSEVSDRNMAVIKERFRARLENIIIIFHPRFFWQRVRVE